MRLSLSSTKGSKPAKPSRKSASGIKQRFLVSFVLLSLLLSTVSEAAESKMMKTFKPTKNLLGVKTKMENRGNNPIISYIATKASQEPTAESMVALLNDMSSQYQSELLQLRSQILNSQNQCSAVTNTYDVSIELREEYLDVLEESYTLSSEHTLYYEDRLEYLVRSQEATQSTSTVVESVLQDLNTQTSIMKGLLEASGESLDGIIETIVTLEPTSMTSVNSPGEYLRMIQGKKAETVSQIQSKVKNLVQFSQADLSLAYNYLSLLQESIFGGYDSYTDRLSSVAVQLGNIKSTLTLLDEDYDDQEEAVSQQKIHLSTMTKNYELITEAVEKSVKRYEQESATYSATCSKYQEQADVLSVQIEEGLDLITELQTSLLTDYESLYYYLNELNKEYGDSY